MKAVLWEYRPLVKVLTADQAQQSLCQKDRELIFSQYNTEQACGLITDLLHNFMIEKEL